jgi:hypothetical protein
MERKQTKRPELPNSQSVILAAPRAAIFLRGKDRIDLEGLRGDDRIAEQCRWEGPRS